VPRPLKAPTSDLFEGQDLEVFERLMGSWMHGHAMADRVASPWMAALMHWPEYAALRVELSRLLLTFPEREGAVSHADREWGDIVLASHMHTNVVLRGHLPDALGAGVRLEAIEAIRSGRDEDLTARELLLATFSQRICDGTVDDELYNAVEAELGNRATVEYVVFITCLWETMRQMNALGQSELTDAEVDQMIGDFKSGAREVPTDWRQRAVGPWPGDPSPTPTGKHWP
jgi:hypothetical protein